ncbi:MAG: porin family protein [Granulosicoccus sp.]
MKKQSNNKAFLLVAVLAAPAIFGSAVAQAGGYLGIEGSSVSVENNLDDELNPVGLRLKLGMRLSDVFDVEGHVGFTGDSRNVAFDDFETGYIGAFLKGYIPLGSRSAFFVLAGISSVEHTQTINGSEFTDDRTGVSWGLGMETQLSERLDLTADWMHYLADEGLFEEITAVSFGLKMYF